MYALPIPFLINHLNSSIKMEVKGELITAAAAVEKKPVTGVKEFIESFQKKETGQPKTGIDKKLPTSPAPFYDELHFANYE